MQIAEIKQRLKDARSSQQELADFMGVDHHVVHRIVNGRRKHLTTEEAGAIRRFFEMRERPIYPTEADDSYRRTGAAEPNGRAEIPVFGGMDTPAGWMLSLSAASQVGRLMAHPGQIGSRRAFAVEVVDDTMSPRFEMGEIAYVSGGQMPRRGQDCLVEFDDLTARILQFMERTDRQVIFRQINPGKQVIRATTDKLALHAIVGRG